MDVEEQGAEFMTHVGHETFYFCSKACEEKFELDQGLRHEEKKWWQRLIKEPQGAPPKCH